MVVIGQLIIQAQSRDNSRYAQAGQTRDTANGQALKR
jgi:hypothetical protein